jgi:hypothetical protein
MATMTSTKKERILSIDVGIKNLSYCVLDVEEGKVQVVEWHNVAVTDANCKKIKLEDISDAVLCTLMEKFDDTFVATTVLIENQPMLKNGLMKTVAVIIYTYFNMLKLQYGNVQSVKFLSASNKLKCKKLRDISSHSRNVDVEKKTYKDRKKLSIELCRRYVSSVCPHLQEWFNKEKKQDDISDCFLQGVYYIEAVLKVEV